MEQRVSFEAVFMATRSMNAIIETATHVKNVRAAIGGNPKTINRIMEKLEITIEEFQKFLDTHFPGREYPYLPPLREINCSHEERGENSSEENLSYSELSYSELEDQYMSALFDLLIFVTQLSNNMKSSGLPDFGLRDMASMNLV